MAANFTANEPDNSVAFNPIGTRKRAICPRREDGRVFSRAGDTADKAMRELDRRGLVMRVKGREQRRIRPSRTRKKSGRPEGRPLWWVTVT